MRDSTYIWAQDVPKLIVAKCCTSTRKGVLLVLRLKLKN
jgi:hypothetical protein